MISFLTYVGSGKILIYLMRKFPPIQRVMNSRELSQQLFSCDLCLGFWVFLFLAPFVNVDIESIKNKFLKWLVIASLSTWLSYLFGIGFDEIHGKTVIIENANREFTAES